MYGRPPNPVVNLRCEWCKQLFAYKVKSHAPVKRCCCEVCKGHLLAWENERKRAKVA